MGWSCFVAFTVVEEQPGNEDDGRVVAWRREQITQPRLAPVRRLDTRYRRTRDCVARWRELNPYGSERRRLQRDLGKHAASARA